MKKIILLSSILFVAGTCLASSIFSKNGFIEENFGLDNYSVGMGETGISSIFRKNFSVSNPALISTVRYTSFGTNIVFGYNYFNDNHSNKYKDKISYLPYANVVIPISKSTFLGFKFMERFHLGLETTNSDSIDIGNLFIDKDLRGAINQFGFSFAGKIKEALIGVNYNYYFGNKISKIEIDFEDEDLLDYLESIEKRYNCSNFSIGFAFPISKFSFGGFYESKLNLHSNKMHIIEDVNNSDFDFVEEEKAKLELPAQFGIGIGMQATDFLYIETNYRQSFWKNTDYPKMNKRDSRFVSFGLSYLPQRKTIWKVPIRLGGYYKQLPCKENESFINEKAMTLGFDIPLKVKNRGKISFAFIYGTRGDISKNNYSDEFVKISLGFSSVDRWRNPQRFKKDNAIPKLDTRYKVPD